MTNTTVRPYVSVVVPMYNTAAYLEKCVESIRHQTLANIEIILVDDGSPDTCGELADTYAERDSRIKVIHQSNKGLGPARNAGIDAATGEYIGFVDSDDWIAPNMYEELYRAASTCQAEIAFAGLTTVAHEQVALIQEQPLAGQTLRGQREIYQVRSSCFGAPPCKLKEDPTPVAVYTGIYRLDFLTANSLRFCNIRSEDRIFNIEAGRQANCVVCISGAPYYYRKDDQPSITKTFSPQTIDSFFQFFLLLEKAATEEAACFRAESLIRTKRCIVDNTRSLIGMIEDSSECAHSKRAHIREVVHNPLLRRALTQYPFWKLPVAQAVFFLALKSQCVALIHLLITAKAQAKVLNIASDPTFFS